MIFKRIHPARSEGNESLQRLNIFFTIVCSFSFLLVQYGTSWIIINWIRSGFEEYITHSVLLIVDPKCYQAKIPCARYLTESGSTAGEMILLKSFASSAPRDLKNG